MKIDDFIATLKDCFTDKGIVLEPTTRYKEIPEWGSMMALVVIAAIDQEYGKIITADEIARTNTVEELFHIVQQK
ncbi:MAG: hypothetical protein RMJ53_09925 [Chitinophagales bacterium]|nr:hypothetical protein [Chitinophagales bacterium]